MFKWLMFWRKPKPEVVKKVEETLAINNIEEMHPTQQASFLLHQIKTVEARIRLMDKEVGILKNTVRVYRDMLNKKSRKPPQSKTV